MKQMGRNFEINNSNLLHTVPMDNPSTDPLLYTLNHGFNECPPHQQYKFVSGKCQDYNVH
jgi:hypothetical protein